MTVEQQVDALTASVEDLKGAVVSKKATLDASVADAQSATAQAQSAKLNALSARDQAEAFKDSAYTAAQSAASATAYQDLSAVALSKAVTAVDVFIYDTSKDSDGGAWRHRCAGTSWYREPLNTATRGARREFPVIAVIVAENNKVTIYDGDDPALPMWMVFTPSGNITCVAALNGIVYWGRVGTASDRQINFPADTIFTRNASVSFNGATNASIADRTIAPLGSGNINTLVNANTNDVAMTVLSDAPIDPATGLPVPTIAVATDGGVSVIRHDGAIVDFTNSNSGFRYSGSVALKQTGEITFSMGASASSNQVTYVFDRIPTMDNQITYNTKIGNALSATAMYTLASGFTADFVPTPSQPFSNNQQFDHVDCAVATKVGMVSLGINHASPARSLFALTASTFLTGWMLGAIRGAFLADTADADLVGNSVFSDDFSSYADNAALRLVWGSINDGVLTLSSGRMRVANGPNGRSGAVISFPTIAGQRYTLVFDGIAGSVASVFAYVGVNSGGASLGALTNVIGNALQIDFVATGASATVSLYPSNTGNGGFVEFDNISVRLADADRSVNNRGLIVSGTIKRSPVATGAELVGYSGFSASNYLEQPYNPALDFNTGDFCLMGWAKRTADTFIGLFGRVEGTATSYGTNWMWAYWGNQMALSTGAGGAAPIGATGNFELPVGVWGHWAIVRHSGIVYLYANGSLVGSGPVATNISINAGLRVGLYYFNSWTGGGANNSALLRISATAPTADQIRRIYDDEKALFQENAACTLYGSSDAVTALAHDPDTGLLHVGTSAGRSVFKGLRRVANTTVAVTAAISAVGDLVVEQ